VKTPRERWVEAALAAKANPLQVVEASLSAVGDRVRMTSVAEVGGYDTSHRPENFAKILATGRELFRDGIALDRAEYWACLRPATPDGPPYIGPTPVRNLWLNTGPGSTI